MTVEYRVVDTDHARANSYPDSHVLPSSFDANYDVVYRFEDGQPVELMWFEDPNLGLEPLAQMLQETYFKGYGDGIKASQWRMRWT